MELFSFNDLTYQLGNNPRQITVSASIPEGGLLAVRGPSGSGKSTLLRILARLQPCQGGQVKLANQKWEEMSSTNWRSQVHYLAQKPAIFEGTVLDNLAKPFELRVQNKHSLDLNKAKKLFIDLLLSPELLDQDAKTLSGGEGSRLAFIRSLLCEPTILLLDEPTAALDIEAREALLQTLTKWLTGPDRAAILVSHNHDYEQFSQLSVLDIPLSEVSNA